MAAHSGEGGTKVRNRVPSEVPYFLQLTLRIQEGYPEHDRGQRTEDIREGLKSLRLILYGLKL